MPIADTYSVVRTINKAGAISVYGFYPNFLILLLQEKIRGEGFFQSFFAKASQPISIQNFSRSFLCVSLCPVLDNAENVPYKNEFFCKRKGKNWTFTFLNKTFRGKVVFFILLWYFTY